MGFLLGAETDGGPLRNAAEKKINILIGADLIHDHYSIIVASLTILPIKTQTKNTDLREDNLVN